MSDEDADEVSEEADDVEEVSQDDEAEALEHAFESEDEQEASQGLAEEDAEEAGEDTDSQPGADEDDSADDSEVEVEEDGIGKEPAWDSTALRESLVSRSEEETLKPEQEQRPESRASKRHKKRKVQSEDPDSLQSLKRQLTEAKRQASATAQPAHDATVTNADSAAAASPQVCCSPYHLSVSCTAEPFCSHSKHRGDSAETIMGHMCNAAARFMPFGICPFT